ncbi:MAG: DUF5702 domain-containing protein [Eubacteriales bacterium]
MIKIFKDNEKHIKYKNKGKNGSIAVFLGIILISMLVIVSLFINLAGLYAGRSMAESSFTAAGRAVLSEFDKELFNDYGIFGLFSSEDEIKRNLYFYSSENLKQEPSVDSIDCIKLNVNSINISNASHSLANIDLFENEIIELMKYRGIAVNLLDMETNIKDLRDNAFEIQIIENSLSLFETIKAIDTIATKIAKSIKAITALEYKLYKSENMVNYQNKMNIISICKELRKENQNLNVILASIPTEAKRFRDSLSIFKAFLAENSSEELKGAGLNIITQVEKAEKLVENLGQGKLVPINNVDIQNIKLLTNIIIRIGKITKENQQTYNIGKDLIAYKSCIPMLALLVLDFDVNSETAKKNDIEEKKLQAANIVKTNNIIKGVVLRNESIINSLPSKDKGEIEINLLNQHALNNFKSKYKITSSIYKDLLISEYILEYFKNHMDKDRIKLETFFKNEAEYVLYGSMSDNSNLNYFRMNFMALRTSLNMIHIYTDNSKLGEVKALALLISPTPWVVATEFLIATVWASVEAAQDLEIIQNGGKVVLVKSQADWRIDFTSFLNGKQNKIKSLKNIKGLNYKDYLQLFLLLEGRNSKILRTMDLVQINMKGRYNKLFNIEEHYNGFDFTAKLSKEEVLPFYGLFGFKEFAVDGIQLY